MQREKDGAFDMAMASFDGAEVCELVGVFSLNKLSPLFNDDSPGPASTGMTGWRP